MNTNTPRISIIIPTLNQGQFIEECILSVLNQSYRNFEIIVIDGGSSDNTLQIINKYTSSFHYWVSEKDHGQSEAINKGLQFASGEIITWLNSDDYYESHTLELVRNAFANNPGLGIFHGRAVLFGKGMRSKIIGLDKDIASHEYLSYMRFPQPASFLLAKGFNKGMPLTESLHYAMDFELIVKLILKGYMVLRIDTVLAHYRLHKGSKSNNDMAFLEEWTLVLKSVFNSIPEAKHFLNALQTFDETATRPLSIYEVSDAFNSSQLTTIFLQHLHLQFHYNYRSHNYKACKKISAYLKLYYKEFYNEMDYRIYIFRLNFVPKFIFFLFRNLTK